MEKELQLIPISRTDSQSLKLFGNLNESCQRLNHYLKDFFNTVSILKEDLKDTDDPGKRKEREESIRYVESRIDLVSAEMDKIARDFPDLVRVQPPL